MEDNSQEEITIGAVESSLGISRLSICKSGEVTVTSPASPLKSTQPTQNNLISLKNNNNNNNMSMSSMNMSMSSNIIPLEKTDSVLMKEQKEEEKMLMNPTPGMDQNGVEMDLSALRGIQPPPTTTTANANNNTPGVNAKSGDGNGNGNGNGNAGGQNENSNGKNSGVLNNSLGKKSSSKHNNMNNASMKTNIGDESDNPDLEALSELVPGLKTGKVGKSAVVVSSDTTTTTPADAATAAAAANVGNHANSTTVMGQNNHSHAIPHLDSMVAQQGVPSEFDDATSKINKMNTVEEETTGTKGNHNDSNDDDDISSSTTTSDGNNTNELIQTYTSKPAIKGLGVESESSDDSKSTAAKTHSSGAPKKVDTSPNEQLTSSNTNTNNNNNNHKTNTTATNNKNLEHPYAQHNTDQTTPTRPHDESIYGCTPNRQEMHHSSSVASISTATQTQTQSHEMRMPMYLPNFRPATGCTNASDFIVRCFAARLRSGITVVKHGRSRWCKSRLRILHVHSDGRSLSWKPAQGEPSSSKRPPKLDLSTCLEVRHAWSPDPLNPMFTGTPILRSKCEASNAFKSFALIFPRRTVDITAVTADQCKVLMEGFSALCFRLQVANMAGRGNRPNHSSMMNDDSGNGGKGGNGGGAGGAAGGGAGSGKEEKGTATSTSISGSMNLSKRI